MYLDSYHCVLCQSSVEETSEHLFFKCPFAKDCWIELTGVTLLNGSSITECILQIRDLTHPVFCMMVAILMSNLDSEK